MRIGLLFTALVMVLTAAYTNPASAARIALVIGNDRYAALPDLQKAENDARAVATALEELSFNVFVGTNLKRRETNRLLADFAAAIQPGDQAFFFFAGHGVAIGAENYLIPSDMPQPRTGEEGLIRDEAHSVHSLIERVQRRGAVSTIFVLDACRDNPFAATGVRSIGSTRGLARVEAPKGVFVLFSAGTGQAALDRLSDTDSNANSVFTRKLVPLLKIPGLTHVRLAKQVQKQVSALARSVSHDQQPAYYDQIIGEIVLKPAQQQATTGTPARAGAAQAWGVIQNTSSPAVLKAYIDRFPDSVFAGFARARLQELGREIEADEKKQRVVAIDPNQAADEASEPAELPPAVDQTELVRAIQSRLNWHRCNAGPADGQWGNKSRRAVRAFSEYAKLSLAALPSDSLLDILNSKKTQICPPAEARPAKVQEVAKQPVQDQTPPPQPATRVFRSPKLNGLPVDICLVPFKKCKGLAAKSYCRSKGYRIAADSKFVLYPETRHIGTGTVCRPRGLVVCGGYSTITCKR
ncbi:MAG: hypothetical protein HKN11_05985 [Rhizobiales bacterium]|nr:hypothetical protein [Hyphomicrobiales bacterium]